MLRAIIADNEEPAISILKILLERTDRVTVVESFLSAADTLSGIRDAKPDVAFLDIEMPETNGLELAERILAVDAGVEIVFVTAYDQYALDAFRVNALDYLLKPLSFEAVEQTVARLVRRKKGAAVPWNEPADFGRIHCFGKFTVYGPGSELPVKWRTSKAEELFAYLVQNLEREVPKWKICEALWPECSADKVDIYLHTTVYKMKKVLDAARIEFIIKFINGCYWMSLSRVCTDAAEFDSIAASGLPVSGETLGTYEKAISLYKNDYLEENDYLWALPRREEYSAKYWEMAVSLAKYYMKTSDYASAERVLKSVLRKCPLDEDLHEMLLKLYFIKKDRVAFTTHYNAVSELLRTELGVEPGGSIQALYGSMC